MMFTIDELATNLKVHRNTVRGLIKEGKLKAIKIGSQYRVPEESFENFTKASAVVEQPSPRELIERNKSN